MQCAARSTCKPSARPWHACSRPPTRARGTRSTLLPLEVVPYRSRPAHPAASWLRNGVNFSEAGGAVTDRQEHDPATKEVIPLRRERIGSAQPSEPCGPPDASLSALSLSEGLTGTGLGLGHVDSTHRWSDLVSLLDEFQRRAELGFTCHGRGTNDASWRGRGAGRLTHIATDPRRMVASTFSIVEPW